MTPGAERIFRYRRYLAAGSISTLTARGELAQQTNVKLTSKPSKVHCNTVTADNPDDGALLCTETVLERTLNSSFFGAVVTGAIAAGLPGAAEAAAERQHAAPRSAAGTSRASAAAGRHDKAAAGRE